MQYPVWYSILLIYVICLLEIFLFYHIFFFNSFSFLIFIYLYFYLFTIFVLWLTDTHQIITLNLPHEKSFVDFAALVKISLGISFFFTYPMMLFPVTHLVDKTFGFTNDRTKGVSIIARTSFTEIFILNIGMMIVVNCAVKTSILSANNSWIFDQWYYYVNIV